MVLVRRKDKRRGNADDELAVASDSSIVANKGVRSLQSARSGRFAADMRANVGGYGRPDTTWGVDHPWHTTEQSDLYSSLCARDHMEDGTLAREQELEREAARGASRAALKKRKAKLKKQGLKAQEAAAVAAKEAEEARRRHEEEARLAAEKVQRERAARKDKKLKHKLEEHADAGEDGKDAGKESNEPDAVVASEEQSQESAESTAQSKKKQKQKQKKQQAKKKAEEQAAGETNEDAEADVGEKTVTAEQEMQSREALAKQYTAAFGGEITTKSGLVVQDQRLGHGKLADIGEMLTVRYRGRLGKDGMVFGKGMLTTRYGTGSVIAGWEEGLGTMRPGGVRHLTIPPELGYGASGKGGKIPPNSTLFFEVELIRFGKRKRDAVGEDDIPLPSAFQRKKIKQKSGKKQADDAEETGLSKSQKKRNRRKHKRPGNDAE